MQPWRTGKVYFWERAPFLRILLPLVAGIGCYVAQGHPVWSIYQAVAITIVCLLGYIVAASTKRQGTPILLLGFIALQLWIFMAGWSLCYLNDIRNDTQWFGKQVSTSNVYIARIDNTPAEKERTWKLSVQVLNTLQHDRVSKATGKAFVYVYKGKTPVPFHKGDMIIIPGKWQPIKNGGNPYEFDYAAYCARNNIYYQKFIAVSDIMLYNRATAGDIGWIARMHDWCMAQLDAYIADKPTKGLLQAMLLGDEVNLDDQLRQSYAATGIVHIIAISGGNVAIFFVVISCLLWWLKDNKYKWVKYIVALPLVWIYVLMAGAPPSAVRAAMMFTIVAIGFALQKDGNGLNALLAAAVVLLCAVPMWLFSVGFQLSFVAVLSLILFYQPIYKLWIPTGVVAKTLWSVVVASIAAEILVAPVVIYYFHLFPLSFIVANVLAYIFMSVVLILAMLIIVFSFIPIAASAIAWFTVVLVTFFDRMVYVLQDYNPTALRYLRLTGIELLLLYVIITAIAVWLMRKYKQGSIIALAAACLLMFFLCCDEWIACHQQRLVVYNMGRSSYVEMITGKQHDIVLTDTGIAASKKDYALQPAHTEWQSWRLADSTNAGIVRVGNSSILLLRDIPRYDSTFPIDYVWINTALNDSGALALRQAFSPHKVILGGGLTGARLGKTLAACVAAGLPVHAVSRDGAFVLDGF